MCTECMRLQAEIDQMERESEIDAAAIRELENENDVLTSEVAALRQAIRESRRLGEDLASIAAFQSRQGRKQQAS